jgi:hypothetical protein
MNTDTCFYFPFCTSDATVCGGQREGLRQCMFVQQKKIVISDWPEFLQLKKKIKQELKRTNVKWRRGGEGGGGRGGLLHSEQWFK